jgi:hypothetical protein
MPAPPPAASKLRLLAAAFLAPLVAGVGVALAVSSGPAARAHWEVLGHVRPAGDYSADVEAFRGVAYLSSHRGRESCKAEGVRAYSLADPRRPRLLATFGRIAGTWTEKTIVRSIRTSTYTGDLAAVSVQGCSLADWRGFALYDVSRPARPLELARVHLDPRGSHELWLTQAGGRALVFTASLRSEALDSPDGVTPGRPDFRIWDVSDPRAPVQVGAWGAWQALGLKPFPDIRRPLDGNLTHSVVTNAAGTRAYLSYWDLGTVVLDVSDPARPLYLGRTAATQNAHSAWLGRGGLLLETHETAGGTVTLYDVSTPSAPRRLSRLRLSSRLLAAGHRNGGMSVVNGLSLADSVHDPKIAGTTAYLSWYSQGVVAADVSNPAKPRVLARFLPPAAKDRESLLCPDRPCSAVWGVDTSGQYVVASDLNSGLWVLRLHR